VGIAGTGAVAQALGQRLHAGGERILALAGRNEPRATRAAAFVDASVQVVALSELPAICERILIAVSDSGIEEVAETLARRVERGGLVLHTSGAAGLAALAPLRRAGVSCGVFHPLQTVATPEQGVRVLEGVAFGISGDPDAVAWATDLATCVGGWPLPVDERGFAAYHAAAVLTSNAAVALVDAATTLMAQAGIDEAQALRALGPLGRTSIEQVFDAGPEATLTGPVVRGDTPTVRAHLDALASSPASVASLYRAASRQLVAVARRRGLPDGRVRELHALLDAGTTGGAE
jgi:predicted short-subunit dehydrogenase-like oxidoreductase (DUF2520 family)